MTENDRIPQVLVVDDEPNIRELVQVALKFHGCSVTTAATGREALRQAEAAQPGPDRARRHDAGHGRLRGLPPAAGGRQRGTGHLPDRPRHVLGHRHRSGHRRRRLRDQAVLGGGAGGQGPRGAATGLPDQRRTARGAGGPLRGGDLELDEDRWTVHRAGVPVELSPTEFRLLAYLMRHEGRVLTRAQLLESVWGWDYAGESQIVETYVSYLRRKLDPLGPPLIHTQRGVGYSFRPARP